jgi:hypothetical protein
VATLDARARLEEMIERALALLDAADGDLDAEPDHDAEDDGAEASSQPATLAPDWFAPRIGGAVL